MSNEHKQIVFNPIGWIIGTIIGVLVISYFISYKSPVNILDMTVLTNKNSNIKYNNRTAVAGEPYQICRKVKYTRDSTIRIDRALLKNLDNGDVISINFPDFSITRKSGIYSVCRYIPMPKFMDEGNWKIKTFVTWEYGLWKHTEEIKDVDIYVYQKELK